MIRIVSIMSISFVCLVMFFPTVQAEDFYDTRCYSGTVTVFNKAPLVWSWAQNVIIMSDDKRSNNMVVHCEGVQMGLRQDREGYGLCKGTDLDGETMIWGSPYGPPGSPWKFISGTGKWKGIKGTFTGQRIVRSKPFKGAMPNTYQGCSRVKGTFELPPK